MVAPVRIELPTQYEAGPVNAYLFLEPEPTLVDTGVRSEASWEALTAALAGHGLGPADLARVVLTHAHVDHFGQARRLAAAGARVETADVVVHRLVHFSDYWQRRTAYYRDIFLPQTGLAAVLQQYILRYFTMVAHNYEDVPAGVIDVFPVGGAIALGGLSWQVLHTPGHCSHQTVYYQPETHQLLASDMLLPRTPTPVVELPADGRHRQPALPTYLRSLAQMAALPVDWVYPGHGAPFTNHRAVIRRQEDRIRQRSAETLACVRAGCRTAADVVARLYADRPLAIQFAGLWMALGYLDLLLADGLIEMREENGVCLYRPT